ncbi:LysM peptidoglycan-binding domain-containing protein [Microbacterium aquimaris]|uniref:LysM peptidoglycan-binding domain-containing protein n=1 Tax=Microbacterium aquimaris TaxID=459816 RepID=A0ABU5N6Q6_9MICO|nr:LysM peptidoglycan-binding domain-containing protein [Microbacterium aquimaris]MDZ8161744.1 LysM peptidoglycan-binding domain-containing protein [Microbacterium aquimaris]
MTAITITPQPRTRLRMTARGRRVFTALAAFPVAACVAVAVISGGGALASRDAGADPASFSTVVVGAGDSLWSIAERVAPSSDPRDVIDDIARLNALDGVAVSAGQELAIPTRYTADGQ